jgi:DNA-binding GntR family transcriptional regulator
VSRRTPLASVFATVEHSTLRDHAYARLREALLTGAFAPGEKLTIRGLAAAFGMSPTPIREAVGRLAAERAIETIPNSFMRVPLLSADALRELRDIRVALEGLATERAASRITPAELAEVKRLDAAIVALRPMGDAKAMIPLISQLHFTVYRAARSPELVRLIEGMWLRTAPHVHLLFPGYTTAERGRLRTALIAALARGDAAAARRSLEADIGNALDYIIALVEVPAAEP